VAAVMLCTAIITAGGSGNRLPGAVKKQYRLLNGKPVIIHTLEHFLQHPQIQQIIITLPEADLDSFPQFLNSYIADHEAVSRIILCAGGEQRQNSVYNALQACNPDTEIVLIHDAVRPFISRELIDLLLIKTAESGACVPVAKVKNTIKVIKNNVIDHTLDREKLVQVHTPQVFSFPLLLDCYRKAMQEGYYSTDDAALFEHYGYQVQVHFDETPNIKITDEFDLFVCGQLLSAAEKKIS
jgi:2-C-methyl-D-erythritol 4-phosphate cytidylyltransferase